MKRLFFLIILVGILLWVHPFSALLATLVLAFRETWTPYEIIIIGIFADVVYGSTLSLAMLSLPLYTLAALILFVIVQRLRKNINTYA